MSRNPRNSDDLLGTIHDLTRRLEALERIDREETEIYIEESDSTIVGETRKDDQGNIVWATSRNRSGSLYPLGQGVFYDSSNYKDVSAFSTYTPAYSMYVYHNPFEAMRFRFTVYVQSGTTMKLRLRYDDNGSLTQIGNEYTITGHNAGEHVASFSNPMTIGLGNQGNNSGRDHEGFLRFEAEVTGGGDAWIFEPTAVMFGSKLFITDTDDTDPMSSLI